MEKDIPDGFGLCFLKLLFQRTCAKVNEAYLSQMVRNLFYTAGSIGLTYTSCVLCNTPLALIL